MNKQERQSTFAAIAQGQNNQFYKLSDEFEEVIAAVEELQAQTAFKASSKVEPVDVINSDAKTAEIRDAVQELQTRFNQLLGKSHE